MEKLDDKSLVSSVTTSVLCENSEGQHNIVYHDWGQHNDNVLFCVHGLTGNGRDFDFIAPYLVEDGYRVVAIDLAGRGQSDFLKNPLDYNYDQYCYDILTVLAHVGVEDSHTVDWLGVSLGGLLGIKLAADIDTPIRRLMLNDVGPEVPKNALDFIHTVIKEQYIFNDLEEFEKRLRDTRGLTWGPLHDHHWDHMAQHNHRFLENGKLTYAYDEKIAHVFKEEPLGTIDLWQAWENIHGPTLVMRGEKSVVLPKSTLEAMHNRAKRFKLDSHILEDCGHVPSLMMPDQIKVVTNWLKETTT